MRGKAAPARDADRWREQLVEAAALAAQLRSDANRLLRRAEREKSDLARTLHDELAQSLTAMSLELSVWNAALDAGRSGSVEDIRAKIAGLARQLGGAINCTRVVSSRLGSRVLEEFGLSAALELLLEKAQQQKGLACDFSGDPAADQLEIDPLRAAQILQLAAEVIELRVQAGAKKLRVRLHIRDDALTLVFEDDGSARCLTPEIHSRVRLLGGVLRANEGELDIEIRLPLQELE
jgi:signal transduction histidine kinase